MEDKRNKEKGGCVGNERREKRKRERVGKKVGERKRWQGGKVYKEAQNTESIKRVQNPTRRQN